MPDGFLPRKRFSPLFTTCVAMIFRRTVVAPHHTGVRVAQRLREVAAERGRDPWVLSPN